MNNHIVNLYNLMISNKENVNKIIDNKEQDFINNEKSLVYGYGLVNRIREEVLNIGNELLFVSNKLNAFSKELYILDYSLLNSYNMINGYLVYDFLVSEYNSVLEELQKILKL